MKTIHDSTSCSRDSTTWKSGGCPEFCVNGISVNVAASSLQSGEHYFEAIQYIRGLDKHYFENRLALCPVCAAKHQHARETDDAEMRQRIVRTHWFDLKTVLDNPE